MLARARGACRVGVEARVVDVEVDVAPRGVSGFRLVGLGATAARGVEQRLLAALRNAGHAPPTRPVTVNFAPASLVKEGPPLDLPLAAALLAADGVVPKDRVASTVMHGELSLDARVRAVPGALAAAEAARSAGLCRYACSPAVASEAAAVTGVAVHAVPDLGTAIALLRGDVPHACERPPECVEEEPDAPDLTDVRGQLQARRALEIAAAGGHGLLMVGPPGAGKSLLARRLPGLLPPLTVDEALVVTRVHSAAGLRLGASGRGLVSRRPFRAPHHGISVAALVGGGTPVGPGEVSLAHCGVLFLDELPEFRRDALEALRQPIEDGEVTIARAASRARLPCRFSMVAAMNPCPCGWHGARVRSCACTPFAVHRYRTRVSGPLLDRLDLQVGLRALSYAEIAASEPGEATVEVRARAVAARRRQLERQGQTNATLSPQRLRGLVRVDDAGADLLEHAMDQLGISGRAHDRTLRVALTIADLAAGADSVNDGPVPLSEGHVAEALAYRLLDRQVAGMDDRQVAGMTHRVTDGPRKDA